MAIGEVTEPSSSSLSVVDKQDGKAIKENYNEVLLYILIDCEVSEFSDWGRKTDTSVDERTRTITKYPSDGGKQCPHLRETRDVGR